MAEKITINAMMEDDMKKTLEKWGYWGALKDGYLKCPCGETVTEENLTALGSKDGKVVLYHHIMCVNG